MAFFLLFLCILHGAQAYSEAEVIQLAQQVYTDNFQHTVIGDCDFNGADPNDMCGRDMGNGCTMAQMFVGEPAECRGVQRNQQEGVPYKAIWGVAYRDIGAMRVMAYKRGGFTNEGVANAGKTALAYAKNKAKTKDSWYGVGVCTTLAAAGQTALAELMGEEPDKWGGTRITMMKEAYHKDGHEYLIVTDSNGQNAVLVDFWYSVLDGSTEGNIKAAANNQNGRWNLAKAKVSTFLMGKPDEKGKNGDPRPIVYVVPAGNGARYFGNNMYYSDYDDYVGDYEDEYYDDDKYYDENYFDDEYYDGNYYDDDYYDDDYYEGQYDDDEMSLFDAGFMEGYRAAREQMAGQHRY